MKRLLLYTNGNHKRLAFDGIISRDNKLIHTHYSLVKSYENTVKSILDKTFEVEYEDFTFRVDEIDDCFERFIKVGKETNLIYGEISGISTSYILDIVYSDGINPPISTQKIADFFDIEIKQNNNLSCDGIAVANNNNYEIEYKKGNYGNVKDRFTIGHELGHIFLHFANKEETFTDTMNEDYQLASRGTTSATIKELTLEKEADLFASSLLIPKDVLIEEINKCETRPYISDLKRIFNISNGAMYKALVRYGLLALVIDDTRPF